jgi:hypothetical protein
MKHDQYTRSKNPYSVLCSQIELTGDNAVIALARKTAHASLATAALTSHTDNYINPNHAFILVEYMNRYGMINLLRYDLVNNREGEHHNLNPKSLILIDSKVAASEKIANEMLYNDLLKFDKFAAQTWSVSIDEAKQLHEEIQRAKRQCEANPMAYNAFGDISIIPKAGDYIREESPAPAEVTTGCLKTSSAIISCGENNVHPLIVGALSPSAHNCFTWARKMLLSLNNKSITKELPISAAAWLGELPCLYIRPNEHNEHNDKQESKSSCCVM